MTVERPELSDTPSQANLIQRFGKPILFLTAALCLAGGYSGLTMPASLYSA